jgi:hypothetical protein
MITRNPCILYNGYGVRDRQVGGKGRGSKKDTIRQSCNKGEKVRRANGVNVYNREEKDKTVAALLSLNECKQREQKKRP